MSDMSVLHSHMLCTPVHIYVMFINWWYIYLCHIHVTYLCVMFMQCVRVLCFLVMFMCM